MSRENLHVAVSLVLAALFITVGNMDSQDQVNEETHYSNMVRDCIWPDFKKTEGDVSANCPRNLQAAK